MADKKKEYSAGNGKRWLIGLGVVVFIAIVIVAIVLLIPANTTSATELLNKSTTTSFMVSQTEKTEYDSFESKVAKTQKINKYLEKMPTEMADVQSLSLTISDVFKHYNDYIIYVENTSAYKQNYKAIKNGLNGTIQTQKQLNSKLGEINKLSESSPTYLQNAWIDFREEYVEWLGHANQTIQGLSNAYQGGMGNSTTNNLASKLILNTVCDYVNVLYQDFKQINTEENENPNRSDYDYDIHGKVVAFDNFATKYLASDVEIKDYYFNNTIKTQFQTIEEFFTLYNETNMQNLIDSIQYISNKAVVSKTYTGVEDTTGVYVQVKVFLLGGV